VRVFVRLLIPVALAAAIVVSAIKAQPAHPHAKPVPTRALQLHH
jgi:hypothetical protein